MAQDTPPVLHPEVAGFFIALGFKVTLLSPTSGALDPIFQCVPPTRELSITFVLCLQAEPTPARRAQAIAALTEAGASYPRRKMRAISPEPLSADSVSEFERAGIECSTYFQSIQQEVPLDRYIECLLAEEEAWRKTHWRGEDWFIPPLGVLDGESAPQSALDAAREWLASPRPGVLMIHADTGIGKSTFMRHLAEQLARDFLRDCRRSVAPLLIPLLDVKRDLSWESLVERHFESRGLPRAGRAILEHLLATGRVVLLYDAFDEIAHQLEPDGMRALYAELTRPLRGQGKAILTCRTQHFQDGEEQRDLLNGGSRSLGLTSLSLRPFSEPQVKAYLAKARPETVAVDWARINEIYHLADLAQRPMLLERITQQLHSLTPGGPLNLASLYAEYAELWMAREAEKQRQSQREHVLRLIPEIAWRIWDSGRKAVPGAELYPMLEQLNEDRRYALSPEELRGIAKDLLSASFFTRDDAGEVAFNHDSFENYFLAKKLHEALRLAETDGMADLLATLRTRPFDRKVALFLVHLAPEPVDWPLQRILREPQRPLIWENARQLLYWSVRARCGMEEGITDADRFRAELRKAIPVELGLEEFDGG